MKSIPKTVVIGANSFLGKKFLLAYRAFYPDCIGTTRHNDGPHFLNLVNPDISSLQLSNKGYQEAIILAAMPNIAICENEKDRTRRVNVDGTLSLIRQLVNEEIMPIFTSTDCVFDGVVGSYEDDAPPHPIIEYGKQKSEIEKQMKDICGYNYLTIRLSKVFSLVKGDGSLLDEMAYILTSGNTIQAAYDQLFCPTLISDLINVVLKIQEKNLKGTINVCSPESWSRYDLATKLANVMNRNADKIKRISLDDLKESFARPKNTTLCVKKLQETIDFSFTPVDQCIKNVAQNWK